MRLAPTVCPVCGEGLAITRLTCPACDTTLEGRFSATPLASLNAEQLAFVELFLRCQGKLSWAAQELRLSYPTVRSRLDEVILALGYEVAESPPGEERQRSAEQRQAILDELAAGRISSSEAIRQLQGA